MLSLILESPTIRLGFFNDSSPARRMNFVQMVIESWGICQIQFTIKKCYFRRSLAHFKSDLG